MVGAEGLGDEARQAQRAAQGQGRRCTQARRYSASDVDRWNRVQLVQDGGYRVASITGSRDIAGNDVPAGTVAVVRSPDFLRAPERATALATLIHQRRLTPSCGGHAPTAERTVGPARMIVESLTPRSGISAQSGPLEIAAVRSLSGDKQTLREAAGAAPQQLSRPPSEQRLI